MCSVSKVNELLGVSGGNSGGIAAVKQVSAAKLKHSRNDFCLVDVREPDEIEADAVSTDQQVTMGKLLHMSGSDEGVATLKEWTKDSTKKIVLLCGTGYRSSIAAKEVGARTGLDIAALSRGIVGLRNPAATVPDLLVVLATKSSGEKMTLALNACAAAATGGETVVLALMGEGVCTFLRKGSNKEAQSEMSLRVEETFVGEPFQPCNAMLAKLVGTGNGVVLACTSCCKSRGIAFGSDLIDCVQPMQMPDLLRMLAETKKTLQFM